jgi:polyferredoxin/plastocyanin
MVAVVIAAAAGCAVVGGLGGTLTAVEPVERAVEIVAQQWGYEPHRLRVQTGDTLRIRLVARDVVHGFFLEGHDVEAEVRPGALGFRTRHPSSEHDFSQVEEIVVTAGRPGKYRYRCSVTCGTLHPFMQGELVVGPNLPFRAGLGATFGVTAGVLGLLLAWRPRSGEGAPTTWRLDLLARFGWLRRLVTRRWFQFAIVLPNVLVLFLFLLAGLFGSPIGNRNIIVTVVWILWWFLLITLLVPLAGRTWCLACPLPFFGEWLARRRLVGVRPDAERSRSLETGSLNWRWPRRWSSTWVQNLLFLALCTFSTILVTRPALTAAVLGLMLVAAVVVHAVFRRRTFCRYLCPLNAWMSVYAMTAVVEVRAKDGGRCAGCREHACCTGSDGAWGCPWMVNPSKLDRNNHCGLCMECVKACPNDNLTVNARPFCSDTRITRTDEAWMALIMIALVIAYSVTLLGPWGTIKRWANVTEVGNWAGFGIHAATVWFMALVVLPAAWFGLAALGRRLAGDRSHSARELFLRYSYLLVPLGLLAWMAFSLPLIMVNYSHILASLSDPFGWGWDLFGTAGVHWSPLRPDLIPVLQIPLLVTGLGLALWRGGAIARELYPDGAAAVRSLLPHAAMCVGVTVVLLRLYVG